MATTPIVETLWRAYAKERFTIAPEAKYVEEARCAFFAGADEVLSYLHQHFDDRNPKLTRADWVLVEAIATELSEFNANVKER